jgi:hypothetical protein
VGTTAADVDDGLGLRLKQQRYEEVGGEIGAFDVDLLSPPPLARLGLGDRLPLL